MTWKRRRQGHVGTLADVEVHYDLSWAGIREFAEVRLEGVERLAHSSSMSRTAFSSFDTSATSRSRNGGFCSRVPVWTCGQEDEHAKHA